MRQAKLREAWVQLVHYMEFDIFWCPGVVKIEACIDSLRSFLYLHPILAESFLEYWIPEPGPVPLVQVVPVCTGRGAVVSSATILDCTGAGLYLGSFGCHPQSSRSATPPLQDLLFSCGEVHPLVDPWSGSCVCTDDKKLTCLGCISHECSLSSLRRIGSCLEPEASVGPVDGELGGRKGAARTAEFAKRRFESRSKFSMWCNDDRGFRGPFTSSLMFCFVRRLKEVHEVQAFRFSPVQSDMAQAATFAHELPST